MNVWKWSDLFNGYFLALEHAEKLEKRGRVAVVVNMYGDAWRVRYM